MPVAVVPVSVVTVRRVAVQKAAEPQPHFGGGRRLPRVAAAEDHVFHLVAAQALRALLAHHPRDGIGDIALAAAVRTDDRGHALIEGELGPIGERFEAVDFEALQAHVCITALRNADCGMRIHCGLNQSAIRNPQSAMERLAGMQPEQMADSNPRLHQNGGRRPLVRNGRQCNKA